MEEKKDDENPFFDYKGYRMKIGFTYVIADPERKGWFLFFVKGRCRGSAPTESAARCCAEFLLLCELLLEESEANQQQISVVGILKFNILKLMKSILNDKSLDDVDFDCDPNGRKFIWVEPQRVNQTKRSKIATSDIGGALKLVVLEKESQEEIDQVHREIEKRSRKH